MNLNKLRGKIAESGTTQTDCAKVLGISTTSFTNKMTGKHPFKVSEVKPLADFLNLSYEEVYAIFFEA